MKAIVTVFAVAGLTSAPAAFADPDFKFGFKYDQAELMSQDGTQSVYNRLKSEVQDQCRDYGLRGIARLKSEQRCVADTMDAALANIASGRLTAYHKAVLAESAG